MSHVPIQILQRPFDYIHTSCSDINTDQYIQIEMSRNFTICLIMLEL